MTKVKVHTGACELEGDVHLAILFAHTDKAQIALKVLFVGADRYITANIVGGYAEACAGYYIFSILSNEGRGVIPRAVWQFNYLNCSECFQINPCHPWGIVCVPKHPPAVNLSIGL